MEKKINRYLIVYNIIYLHKYVRFCIPETMSFIITYEFLHDLSDIWVPWNGNKLIFTDDWWVYLVWKKTAHLLWKHPEVSLLGMDMTASIYDIPGTPGIGFILLLLLMVQERHLLHNSGLVHYSRRGSIISFSFIISPNLLCMNGILIF